MLKSQEILKEKFEQLAQATGYDTSAMNARLNGEPVYMDLEHTARMGYRIIGKYVDEPLNSCMLLGLDPRTPPRENREMIAFIEGLLLGMEMNTPKKNERGVYGNYVQFS